MVNEGLQELKEKIIASKQLNADELETKIQEKMDSLGSLISEEGAAHIIANELGISLGAGPSTETKLKDVHAGMKNVFVLVKVLKKYEVRSFGPDGSGKVGSVFVGDETGFSRLTFWNDKTSYLSQFNEGDVLEIQHAYSRENNDRVEIHMGSSSHCIINPEGKEVTVKERSQTQEENPKKLNEITEQDTFVNITATIVQVYDPRFFESCPECNKRMQEQDGGFVCVTHGKQEPKFNYVMNLFLDDGTSNLRASLWKEQINILLGKSEDEVLTLRTNQDLLEQTKTDLLGKIISARARVRKNENYNNLELVLYQIEPDPKPKPQTSTATQVETSNVDTTPTNTPQAESSTSKAAVTQNIDEELIKDDDEELLSIDDLDDEDL